MAKERKRKASEADVVVHASYGAPGGAAAVTAQPEVSYNVVDAETVKYFSEAAEHLAGIDDEEERGLLVGNVLDEAAGKEAVVASHPTCSRALEALVPSAEGARLLAFLRAILEAEGGAQFEAIATNPFGSHVLERVLGTLDGKLAYADTEQFNAVRQVLEQMTALMVDYVYQYAADRYGSHVLRRLLTVLCGRAVVPATAAAAGTAAKGLKAKMQGAHNSSAMEEGPLRWPDLVRRFALALIHSDPEGTATLGDLCCHSTGSPFLQALLTALKDESKVLGPLVKRLLGGPAVARGESGTGAGLQDLSRDYVIGLMQDRTGSHLVEVIMTVASEAALVELAGSYLQGSLPNLALHPFANFSLQAYFAAITRGQQVLAAISELKDVFPDLLRKRRGGVLAALLAAAGRTGMGQPQACKALAKALAETQPTTVAAGKQGLAASLLLLDTPLKLGPEGALPEAGRFAPLGCAMLATVLGFAHEACQEFTISITSFSGPALARIGADSGGSRVLDVFMAGGSAAKQKKRFLRALKGRFAGLAGLTAGSHFVEHCYQLAGQQEKEMIVSELAAAHAQLSATPRGPNLLRKLGVDAYLTSPDTWRTRVASATAVRSQFAKIFGDDPQLAASGPALGQGAKRGRAQTEAERGGGDGEEGRDDEDASGEQDGNGVGNEMGHGQVDEEGGLGDDDRQHVDGSGPEDDGMQEDRSKKRKKKKRRDEQADTETAAGGTGQGLAADVGMEPDQEEPQQKPKRKKKGKVAEEPGIESVEASLDQRAAKHEKKKKKRKGLEPAADTGTASVVPAGSEVKAVKVKKKKVKPSGA